MSSVAPTSSLVSPEGAERAAENLGDAARGEPPFKTEQTGRGRLGGSLFDALAAAAIAAAITLFFLYLRMDVGTGGVSVAFRPGLWLAVIPVVAVARFLLSYFVFRSGKERAGVQAPAKLSAKAGAAAPARPLAGTAFAVLLLALAFAAPLLILTFLPNQDRYLITLAILIMTYIMLGWGLNIVVGLAGLLDLGYVAFYGVGAYSFALLATNFGLGFWVCLPMAGLFAALWGIMLGFPVLRLRGDYLAIVTLAFGEIIRVVIINWSDVTGGPNGLGRLPAPTFFGLEFKRGAGGFADTFGLGYDTIHRFVFLYYIILALALLTNFITLRMRRLPIGRAWEALREDEIACRSLGINTTNVKLTAFATGAMFGGFAGSFFATSQGSITPESFTYLESATILAIVVLGGLGSQLGIVLSSIAMIGGLEMLRHLTALKRVFGEDFEPTQYRMLIFGAAMIAIMIWKPRGLISFRQPSAVYKERKRIGAAMVAQGEGH